MPVECSVEILPLEEERFHQLDKMVMRTAFDIHNELGKFCDEQIYRDELARGCTYASLSCVREVQLRVSLGSFEKSYYLDLLVGQGGIYELKAVTSLVGAHHNQLINYLLLAGIQHGKLINFRSASVQSRFVSTRLTRVDRMSFRLTETEWLVCYETARLKSALEWILQEFGTFLDIGLYREILLQLLEAHGAGYLPVPILRSTTEVGYQKMCLLGPEHAWHISSIKTALGVHETHVMRLMRHTPLKFIHWINFNRNHVTLKTIRK